MKRVLALVGLLALVFGSCQSAPPIPSYGSVDSAAVELLANGKAKVIDIVGFNDFHGTLAEEPKGKNPGIAKLAGAILALRAANPNTLLLSGGDNYQGSALPAITKGKVVNEFFKLVGLAASAVGNHEFDWGPGYFRDWSAQGGFPFLAANIKDRASGKQVAWAEPYLVLNLGGHRVAVLGLSSLTTLSTTKQEFIAGLEFTDPAVAAAEWVPAIRKKENPELLIVLTHVPSVADKADPAKALGTPEFFELDSLAKVPGIDAIITAHSHNTVAGFAGKVPVIQGYYNGRTLGRLRVTFAEDGSFGIVPSVEEIYKTKDSIAPSPAAAKILDDATALYGKELGAVVARLTAELPHPANANVTPMGKWVCDLMRARYGVQVAFQNGGGLRKGFAAGDLKVSDFWELMPFDNYTITFTVSGKALKEIVAHGLDSKDFGNGQFSGLRLVYDPALAGAERILSMTLDDGSPVVDGGTYTVAMNDFQFGGGDKYAMVKPAAGSVKETFEPIREMLIEEARKAGTIVPPSVDGIVTKK